MPKLPKTAQEEAAPIPETIEKMVGSLSIATEPVFICGVNRKINIGNFENIDVYAAISLPLNNASLEDKEFLQQAVHEAAEYAFSLMSRETGERYMLIKESQQGN